MDRLDLLHPQMMGARAAIRAVSEDIDAAASCDMRVMIVGEPAVGREAVACAIHGRSAHPYGRLTTVDATGVSDNALATRIFRALSVPGGTLFLDNIDELSHRSQDLLFGILDSNELPRDRSEDPTPFNVRLITGTGNDLMALVRAGTFREDLYYRLNAILICLPPMGDVTCMFEPGWGASLAI